MSSFKLLEFLKKVLSFTNFISIISEVSRYVKNSLVTISFSLTAFKLFLKGMRKLVIASSLIEKRYGNRIVKKITIPKTVIIQKENAQKRKKATLVKFELKKLRHVKMKRDLKFKILDWDNAIRLSIDLARKIDHQFSPEALICILRGGAVVGRIMADYFQIKELFAIKTSLYGGIDTKKEKIKITQGLTCDLREKKTIVVDDIVDTGKTLSTIIEYLQKTKAKEIKGGVLHWKPWAKVNPEFKMETVESWVVYPWEYNEFISLAREKLKSEKTNEKEKNRIRRAINTIKTQYSTYTKNEA